MWFPYDHNSDRFHMSPTDRGHVAEASPTVTIIWKPAFTVKAEDRRFEDYLKIDFHDYITIRILLCHLIPFDSNIASAGRSV